MHNISIEIKLKHIMCQFTHHNFDNKRLKYLFFTKISFKHFIKEQYNIVIGYLWLK